MLEQFLDTWTSELLKFNKQFGNVRGRIKMFLVRRKIKSTFDHLHKSMLSYGNIIISIGNTMNDIGEKHSEEIDKILETGAEMVQIATPQIASLIASLTPSALKIREQMLKMEPTAKEAAKQIEKAVTNHENTAREVCSLMDEDFDEVDKAFKESQKGLFDVKVTRKRSRK